MVSAYLYYPQQIQAAKLIKNKQKLDVPNKKKSSRYKNKPKYIEHSVNTCKDLKN